MLEQAWPLLDLSALKSTLPQFKVAVASVVHRYGLMSAAVATRFYEQQRRLAGVDSPFLVKPAKPAPVEQTATTMDWATKELWTRDLTPQIVQAVQGTVTSSAEKLSLDTGRNTIVDNTQRDKHAIAWARVPEPGACYFCALLCTRGAVYKEATASFRTHDRCRCHAEPVFHAYEPSAQVREWTALYASSTRSVSGKAKINAFRQALAAQSS